MTTTQEREHALPVWLRDWEAFTALARLQARRVRGLGLFHGIRIPKYLLLVVGYVLRGFGRATAQLGKWMASKDTADLRADHVGRRETPDMLKAQAVHRANIHARLTVAVTVALLVGGPVAFVFAPYVLSTVVGLIVATLIVKLIPGRKLEELVYAALAWLAVGWGGGAWLDSLVLPVWVPWSLYGLGGVALVLLGWHGRPMAKPDGQGGKYSDPANPGKPSAEMVVAAIIAIAANTNEKQHLDQFRVHAPGVGRDRRGWHVSMELPQHLTASDIIEERETFAGALRRHLGTVWPARGPMHPGHLLLFISDEPMATAPQSAWPLAEGKRVDIFDKLPLFTDQQGRWFDQRLAYNAIVVGGAPGFGKSYALREIGVAVSLDPRTKVKCYDGKGNGDLRPLRLVADEFYEGDEPDDIARQLASVQAVREEMRRRARFLRELPHDINPENKVTSELVDRFPALAPIVLLFDEVQVYTEHEDKPTREAFGSAMADLVRRGRSAGIIPVFCTQKPDAKAIPTAITDNCSVRLCFRVNGQRANDTVLGTEMHSSGIKATKFGPDDKGLAWLKGDGAEPLVVRTVFGFDNPAAEAITVKARAMRERLGLLTGYAAGGEAEEEERQVNLLEDVRHVFQDAAAMTLGEILDGLALLRPDLYGPWDVDTLGSALGDAGVKRATVYSAGAKSKGRGVKREWLDVAATSDEDGDDGDAEVIELPER